MSEEEIAIQEQNEEENELDSEIGSTVNDKDDFLFKSKNFREAVHMISELLNTRLSTEALNHCIILLNARVDPKKLAKFVLHILEVKRKKLNEVYSPLLP